MNSMQAEGENAIMDCNRLAVLSYMFDDVARLEAFNLVQTNHHKDHNIDSFLFPFFVLVYILNTLFDLFASFPHNMDTDSWLSFVQFLFGQFDIFLA